MAYVFFRIPEDSNLWAERPRAKAFPRLERHRASRLLPGGEEGRGGGSGLGGARRAGGVTCLTPAWRAGTGHRGPPRGPSPPLAAARPHSSLGSWKLPDPAGFPALRAGS